MLARATSRRRENLKNDAHTIQKISTVIERIAFIIAMAGPALRKADESNAYPTLFQETVAMWGDM